MSSLLDLAGLRWSRLLPEANMKTKRPWTTPRRGYRHMSLVISLTFGMPPLLTSTSHSQAAPDLVHQRNDCRLAAQIVRTGTPAPHERWALAYIPRCGSDGAAAMAAGLRALRTSSDTAILDGFTTHMRNFRDAELLTAALDVAGDKHAAPAARVFAFRDLISLEEPNRVVEYEDMTH